MYVADTPPPNFLHHFFISALIDRQGMKSIARSVLAFHSHLGSGAAQALYTVFGPPSG